MSRLRNLGPSRRKAVRPPPIPDYVLQRPILGEAIRYDGTVAPAGWLLAQGQWLSVADNRSLFSILGRMGGGDGKATFKLPKSSFGWIVAVTGAFPNGPGFLADLGRHVTPQDSVGKGALLPMPAFKKIIVDRAAERARASAVTPTNTPPRPLPADLLERLRRAQTDARDAVVPGQPQPARRGGRGDRRRFGDGRVSTGTAGSGASRSAERS